MAAPSETLAHIHRAQLPLDDFREQVGAAAQREPDLDLGHVSHKSVEVFARHGGTHWREARRDLPLRSLEPLLP